MLDAPLNAQTPLTVQLRTLNISTWLQALHYIQQLPYGRNANRLDLSLVITESKGTCSSKHALLKAIADENKIEVDLILGMYKMNTSNTPGIGQVLEQSNLTYIPEAHCYLKSNQSRFDFTSSSSDIKNIEPDILEEQTINPEQVADYKVDYHQSFLEKWLDKEEIDMSLDELWAIREQCIKALS